MHTKIILSIILGTMISWYVGVSAAAAFGEAVVGATQFKSVTFFNLTQAGIDISASNAQDVDHFCGQLGFKDGTKPDMFKIEGNKLIWAFCYSK